MLEAVDVMLGVRDGGVRVVPGEADFECGEGVAVDDEGALVGAADAGVPEAAAGFERLDVVTLVKAGHGRFPGLFRPKGARIRGEPCEAVHTCRLFCGPPLRRAAGIAAARMTQRRKAAKSRCSVRNGR